MNWEWLKFAGGIWLLFASATFGAGPQNPAGKNQVVRLQGHVLRLPGPATNLVFKAESGASFTLNRGPMSEALFLDTNLWSKVLLLTGKPHDHSFEVTGNLHSIKDGKVYELFYYCDVCSISSSVPGLCQCCREPTVLTEKPSHE